jgi:hypothetical protein
VGAADAGADPADRTRGGWTRQVQRFVRLASSHKASRQRGWVADPLQDRPGGAGPADRQSGLARATDAPNARRPGLAAGCAHQLAPDPASLSTVSVGPGRATFRQCSRAPGHTPRPAVGLDPARYAHGLPESDIALSPAVELRSMAAKTTRS